MSKPYTLIPSVGALVTIILLSVNAYTPAKLSMPELRALPAYNADWTELRAHCQATSGFLTQRKNGDCTDFADDILRRACKAGKPMPQYMAGHLNSGDFDADDMPLSFLDKAQK